MPAVGLDDGVSAVHGIERVQPATESGQFFSIVQPQAWTKEVRPGKVTTGWPSLFRPIKIFVKDLRFEVRRPGATVFLRVEKIEHKTKPKISLSARVLNPYVSSVQLARIRLPSLLTDNDVNPACGGGQ
jgi:hypothetical protein